MGGRGTRHSGWRQERAAGGDAKGLRAKGSGGGLVSSLCPLQATKACLLAAGWLHWGSTSASTCPRAMWPKRWSRPGELLQCF